VMVGVEPTILPVESAIMTLWGTDDAFSKTIVTEPADAVSFVCWKASIPAGSAWSVSFALAVAFAGALTPVAGAVAVVGVVAVAVVSVVELELDDPQPARAKAPRTQATDGVRSLVFKGFASDSLSAQGRFSPIGAISVAAQRDTRREPGDRGKDEARRSHRLARSGAGPASWGAARVGRRIL
jgi:hypothetical protein